MRRRGGWQGWIHSALGPVAPAPILEVVADAEPPAEPSNGAHIVIPAPRPPAPSAAANSVAEGEARAPPELASSSSLHPAARPSWRDTAVQALVRRQSDPSPLTEAAKRAGTGGLGPSAPAQDEPALLEVLPEPSGEVSAADSTARSAQPRSHLGESPYAAAQHPTLETAEVGGSENRIRREGVRASACAPAPRSAAEESRVAPAPREEGACREPHVSCDASLDIIDDGIDGTGATSCAAPVFGAAPSASPVSGAASPASPIFGAAPSAAPAVVASSLAHPAKEEETDADSPSPPATPPAKPPLLSAVAGHSDWETAGNARGRRQRWKGAQLPAGLFTGAMRAPGCDVRAPGCDGEREAEATSVLSDQTATIHEDEWASSSVSSQDPEAARSIAQAGKGMPTVPVARSAAPTPTQQVAAGSAFGRRRCATPTKPLFPNHKASQAAAPPQVATPPATAASARQPERARKSNASPRASLRHAWSLVARRAASWVRNARKAATQVRLPELTVPMPPPGAPRATALMLLLYACLISLAVIPGLAQRRIADLAVWATLSVLTWGSPRVSAHLVRAQSISRPPARTPASRQLPRALRAPSARPGLAEFSHLR